MLYPFFFMALGVSYIYLGFTSWMNGFFVFSFIFGLGGLGVYAIGLLGMISGLFSWVRHRFDLDDKNPVPLDPPPEYPGLRLTSKETPMV